jgi:DNA polymerase I
MLFYRYRNACVDLQTRTVYHSTKIMKNQLLIIDGSSYVFRAFYGVRANLTNRQGLPTNAVFGFKNMMLQLLRQEDPSHCVMVFDKPGRSFRHDIYPEYKANRLAAPEPLKVQFEAIYRFNEYLNIPLVWQDGVEADDVIGSLVRKLADQIQVVIVSGDKDLTQLVTAEVTMLDTMNHKWYTPDTVREKFGVPPEQIPEYLAIIGDSSDNIPGATGIGPKTAVKLFQQFGSLDAILTNIDRLKGKQKENLASSRENIELSLKLTRIRCDLELTAELTDFRRQPPDIIRLTEFYQEMNFRPDELVQNMNDHQPTTPITNIGPKTLDYSRYELVTEIERLRILRDIMLQQTEVAIDLETTALKAISAEIVGLSFAWENGDPFYIPVAHQEATQQIPITTVLELCQPVFDRPDLRIIGQNIKYDLMVLANYGVTVRGRIHDTMIQSYLLDANAHRHNLDELAERHLGHRMIRYEEVTGKGKQQIPFAAVPLTQALHYAAEDVDATLQIHRKLRPLLEKEGLTALYHEIEIPLCRTLAKMETHGVKLDVDYLRELCEGLRTDLQSLQVRIYEQAGETFNINSPQQLASVLFDKLGIQTGRKKTKTGYSTEAAVLEQIARSEPIAADILAFRSKTKLINTYLEVLPTLIHPKTGRVHTSYSQTVAATGRLSSSNPNLQNIPIRGEDGSKIRRAFIAEPGFVIVSADYSQIELRFLAHLSSDACLIEVFRRDGDIHTETAAAIYGLTADTVTNSQRQAAKAINFGIIYGMGAYRLSQELRISHQEAQAFIDAYFERYPKIRDYMDNTIAFCRENGYVETLFKRKRLIPDIRSENHSFRTGAERMAINSRIQGSAADLIKIAMVNIQEKIDHRFPETKMIMQVHDELVFEIPETEPEPVSEMIRTAMEEAATLSVPLKVNISAGTNWQEAH